MSSNHTGVLYPLRKSAAGSADRNKGPILSVVGPLLDDLYGSRPLSRKNLRILELASGEGRQVAHIASNLPTYDFHPSEADEASCAQIDDVVASTTPPLANVQKAKVLKIEEPDNWRTATRQRPVDAVFAFNLVHIAPWEVTQCLFEMVANPEILADEGLVALYGAWNEQGQFTSDGNREFDAVLKERDARFGLRDVDSELVPLAKEHGFLLTQRTEMPAAFSRLQQTAAAIEHDMTRDSLPFVR